MKRKALGKGLSSLIPEAPAVKPTSREEPAEGQSRLRNLDIDLIRPNRSQPRQDFDEEALFDLANSLKTKGIIQPIVVREHGDGTYQIVAGERRWRAAQQAGLLKIPALVHQVPDSELLEFALIENIQREELNPLEEAAAYRTLMDDLELTQEQVASRVGKRRATIANMLRLLTLAPKVQDMVRRGAVGMGHARTLVSLGDRRDQEQIADRIEKEGLSVRQVERLVARVKQGPDEVGEKPGKVVDPNVQAATESLQSALGTRVRIVQGKSGGRLELHYGSDEELQRIYNLIFDAAKEGF